MHKIDVIRQNNIPMTKLIALNAMLPKNTTIMNICS